MSNEAYHKMAAPPPPYPQHQQRQPAQTTVQVETTTYPTYPTNTAPQPGSYIQALQPPPPPPQSRQVIYVSESGGAFGSLQTSIPVMPMCVAVTLCIVNWMLPGFGTMIAAFTVFCCAKVPETGSSKFSAFCINFWLGWAQLLTIWVFFLGWIWSIVWGVMFVTISADASRKHKVIATTTTTVQSVPAPVGVPQPYEQPQIQLPQSAPNYPVSGYTNQAMVAPK